MYGFIPLRGTANHENSKLTQSGSAQFIREYNFLVRQEDSCLIWFLTTKPWVNLDNMHHFGFGEA